MLPPVVLLKDHSELSQEHELSHVTRTLAPQPSIFCNKTLPSETLSLGSPALVLVLLAKESKSDSQNTTSSRTGPCLAGIRESCVRANKVFIRPVRPTYPNYPVCGEKSVLRYKAANEDGAVRSSDRSGLGTVRTRCGCGCQTAKRSASLRGSRTCYFPLSKYHEQNCRRDS